MNVFPLNTLPKRAMSRVNEYILWPLKTRTEAQRGRKRAQEKEGFVPTTILFYPEAPKTYHTLYKICNHLGWDITTNPEDQFDTVIFFEDTTKRTIPQKLQAIAQSKQVLNLHSTDISKSHVNAVFEEVFGYAMSVDPETYEGTCVRKSDTNAVHDGTIIECPSPREDGYVYQKYVDTVDTNGRAYDLRLHLFNKQVPIVIKRYKDPNDLFNITIDAEFVEPHSVLSESELTHIAHFAEKLGIDYGEFDALRDSSDGKLYIVDTNNTPAGPIGPLYEKPADLERWFNDVAQEAQKAFLPSSE